MPKHIRPSKLERKMRVVYHRAQTLSKESYIGSHTREILLAQNRMLRLSMMLIHLTRDNRCTSKKIRQAEMEMRSLVDYLKQELKFIKNRSKKKDVTPLDLDLNVKSAELIESQLESFLNAYSSKGKVKNK